MWCKTLFIVVGLVVVAGCNRTDPGDPPTAEKEVLALKDADAFAARAYDWLCEGNYEKALRDYDSALRLKPTNAAFLNSRGFTWHMKSIEDEDRSASEERALTDYTEAIRIDPKNVSAINNRAWLWATTKADRCRNGKRAVEEATKACELTGWENPGYLDTLSVAYGEVSDFEQAIRWQRKALEDLAYQKEEGDNARIKLGLFARKQPFRE